MAYVIPAPPIPVLPVRRTHELFPVNRIFCVGQNYAEHTREMGRNPEREHPCFFMKPGRSILPEGKQFPYPRLSENVHYECELVVALLSGGPNVPAGEALRHVFGYAVGLDMTRRDLQANARKLGQPWETAKSYDYSAPCSAISPASEIGHPARGFIRLDQNGKRMQSADISSLIWKVPEIIAVLSTYFTLAAGDLIFTGTPAGVGPVKRGDVLHGAIENVNELTVRVI
jgi:fumarylpyruvate hydrolase